MIKRWSLVVSVGILGVIVLVVGAILIGDNSARDVLVPGSAGGVLISGATGLIMGVVLRSLSKVSAWVKQKGEERKGKVTVAFWLMSAVIIIFGLALFFALVFMPSLTGLYIGLKLATLSRLVATLVGFLVVGKILQGWPDRGF